jgi:hypothetical protein
MIRETSKDAYRDLVDRGVLPHRRREVYRWIYLEGPCTAAMLEHGLGGSSAHKRLSELRDLGYIKEVDKAKCPRTGQRVIWWDVTAKRPKSPVRKKKC